ncbi:MAG TPA: PEP-CTERM sorting domain-containing protein [Fimbriimonadaceae bacterium]|nr:PEP-CTERM sorting domain-containing protein [Fimbriimonadaceae bacterium]
MRTYTLVFLGAALVTPAMSVSFVVDDFTSGVPHSASVVGNGTATSRTTGSMFGGSRLILAADFDSAYGLRSSIDALPGIAAISNDVGNSGQFWLAYLSTGALVNGFTYSPATDTDLSGISKFEFDVLSSDKGFTLNVWLIGDGVSQWSKAFGPIGAPATIDVSVSDAVSSGADMSKIDAFYFEFLTERDGDLALTEIRAVPEPASLAALSLGAVALLRRRRK